MNRPKPPPVDLDKYCEGRSRNFVSYQDGARMYGMSYWGFVRLCQEIEANIPLRKTSIVDRYVNDKFEGNILSTQGVCFFSKLLEFPETKQNCKLDVKYNII